MPTHSKAPSQAATGTPGPSSETVKGLMALLGIRIERADTGQVVATMPITESHLQPFGYLHGGATLALAETVASIGAMQHAPEDHVVFALEINANHLRSRRSGVLRAEGRPLHAGRTTQVWEVRITEGEELIALSRCTLAVRRARTEPTES